MQPAAITSIENLVASSVPSASFAKVAESQSVTAFAGMIREILQRPQNVAAGGVPALQRLAAKAGDPAKSPGRALSAVFVLATRPAPVPPVPNTIIVSPQHGDDVQQGASPLSPLDLTGPKATAAAAIPGLAPLTGLTFKVDSSSTLATTDVVLPPASQTAVAPNRGADLSHAAKALTSELNLHSNPTDDGAAASHTSVPITLPTPATTFSIPGSPLAESQVVSGPPALAVLSSAGDSVGSASHDPLTFLRAESVPQANNSFDDLLSSRSGAGGDTVDTPSPVSDNPTPAAQQPTASGDLAGSLKATAADAVGPKVSAGRSQAGEIFSGLANSLALMGTTSADFRQVNSAASRATNSATLATGLAANLAEGLPVSSSGEGSAVPLPLARAIATAPASPLPLPEISRVGIAKLDSGAAPYETTVTTAAKEPAHIAFSPEILSRILIVQHLILTLDPVVKASPPTGPALPQRVVAPSDADGSNTGNGFSQDAALEHRSPGTADWNATAAVSLSKNASGGGFAPVPEATPQTPPNATPTSVAPSLVPPTSAPPSSVVVSAQPPAPHENPSSDPTPEPLPAPQTDPPNAGHFVSDAQLSQTAGRSEMRIALQSDNLGNIEVHAKFTGDSLGANITVEKRDAHTALANDLPALQQALSDQQLRVGQISLLHGALQAAGGDSSAQHFGGQGQGTQRQGQNFSRATTADVSGSFLPPTVFSTETAEIFNAQGRLSVLA